MGLTKEYLAFKPVGNFNIVASARCNVSFITINATEGRYVVVGAAESAIIWDLRLAQKVLELPKEKKEVCALRPSPDKIHLAISYVDGSVEIHDLQRQECVSTFAVHRSAINCLRYDLTGIKLISAGQDTDIVVLDVVSQSGQCKLSGHRGPVTDVHFLDRFGQIIVSCSKDTQIKFWDIETHCCFKTIVDHKSEVWALALLSDSSYLVSGSTESTLHVYKISLNDGTAMGDTSTQLIDDNNAFESDIISPINCKLIGNIQRKGKGRTISLAVDQDGNVLGCHGSDDQIELFHFLSNNEALKRLSKRLKKISVEQQADNQISKNISLSDEIKRLPVIKTQCKMKSIDLLKGINNELRVVVTSANNFIQLFSLNIKEKHAEPTNLRTLSQLGHHTEVRSVLFSSDNLAVVSGSGDSLKLWNRETLNCIRTIQTGYILTSCFVPGDRHVLLGMKTGELIIADIVTGDLIETIPAHKKELWSICLLPDQKGCVTGGGDTTVKIWTFELIQEPNAENSNSKILSLLHRNTLKLEETVLCVKVSPNSKFIACALLDSTIKIFFLDSFKFYLSLYGHKLPVTCMDISDDSSLIATGSADRNVKIWGMDFGDCHRSMFAHDDSVMGLQFIPKTHMFFTCGKDGKIKQWDGDTFEKVITLPGHLGESYGLAVSPNGHYLVTCGSDKCLRLFEKTDEPIVLQDVQEEEREELESRTLATGEDSTVPGLPGLKLPSKKTVGAEKAAESILECLEISNQFDNDEKKERHPLMIFYEAANTSDFLLSILSNIRASDLEEALLLIPFTSVCEIIKKIYHLAGARKDQTELICKVVLFLFRIHQKPISNNHVMYSEIRKMIIKLQEILIEFRDMIGTNYHGLKMLQREIEAREGVELFKDSSKAKKQKDKKRKQRQVAKRAFIQLNT